MVEVFTTADNLHIFLSLTGHAFDTHVPDANRTHGYYWAMRWLARQVLGEHWCNCLALVA